MERNNPIILNPEPSKKPANATVIKNLVLEGGGVKGLAYAGSLKVLHEQGHMATLEHIAGASAGAITALIIGLGYSLAEIEQILKTTNLASFEDGPKDPGGKFFKIVGKWGINPGNTFENWLKGLIKEKLGNPEATFADLHHQVVKQGSSQAPFRYRDVHFIGANLSTQLPEIFSYYKTSEMPIYAAVRISMAIPLFFEPKTYLKDQTQQFVYQNKQLVEDAKQGHMYVDGGLASNFPLHLFDTDHPNPQTLGIKLDKPDEVAYFQKGKLPEAKPITSFKNYALSLIETARSAQHRGYEVDLFRTIYINTGHVHTTQFNLSEEDKNFLLKQGERAAKDFFTQGFVQGPRKDALFVTDKQRQEKYDRYHMYAKSSRLYAQGPAIQLVYAVDSNDEIDALATKVHKYVGRLERQVGVLQVQHYRQVGQLKHVINISITPFLVCEFQKWQTKQGKAHPTYSKRLEPQTDALVLLHTSTVKLQPRWMLQHTTALQQSGKELGDAINQADVARAMELIQEGANLMYCDTKGNSLLHLVACTSRDGLMRELLDRQLSIESTNHYGDTPLHAAVSLQARELDPEAKVLAVLLERGANVNAVNRQGNTPLMLAAADGYLAAVEKLLLYGAEVHYANSQGYTALSKAEHAQHPAIVERLRALSLASVQDAPRPSI